MVRRLVDVTKTPLAVVGGWFMLLLSAAFFQLFGVFWKFMVLDADREKMGSFSIFLERAFPMRETNGTRFEYNLTHIIGLAIVFSTMYMRFTNTTTDIWEDGDYKGKKRGFTFQANR